MDRAGTYHHGQAIVLAVQDPVQSLASAGDSRRGRRIRRLLFDHLFGGAQLPEATDAQIVGKGFHGGGSCWARRRYKKKPPGGLAVSLDARFKPSRRTQSSLRRRHGEAVIPEAEGMDGRHHGMMDSTPPTVPATLAGSRNPTRGDHHYYRHAKLHAHNKCASRWIGGQSRKP